MELTPKQQVVEMLRSSKNFLILTHKNPDGDALGSMLALYLTLSRLEKNVIIACSEIIPSVFAFLPGIDKIETGFTGARDFVISLNTEAVAADKIMYKVHDGHLDIVISPKAGQFSKELVSFPKGGFNFDAILVLDSPDLERVGKLYEENSDIFFEVPVVNIDHHAGNDHFGKINFVDLTATSTAEILVSIIESLTGDPKFFDENIATSLLTGIVTDTNSFQNTNTTPKSLTVAAQLVALGGRQQEIIKNIYKTKSFSTLRLWGRALSNLHDEQEYSFVWSTVFKNDYLETGANEDEASGLIDELLKTASGVEFALLLSEQGGDIHGSLRATSPSHDVREIAALFGGGGHTAAAGFQLSGTTIQESGDKIINQIKNFQREKKSNIEKKIA